MAINILDTLTINRISAGEVVESPFSIVKELIDNSLDAGATKIVVEIQKGGIDYISVKDNGKGIEKDDMVKAFLPHATSKISTATDLEDISTLGFRGEALASISNVSQTTLTTKTKLDEVANTITVNGGDFGEISVCDGIDGTKLEIKNLFFNTPARRKFLKSAKQEENQITNIISRYILAHPNIEIKYIADGTTIYNSKGGTLLDAISCVYDNETTQNIMYIEKQIGNYKLSGYVSQIGFSKPNTSYQTLIINSRYVVDEIVSKATYMAFEEYLMTRQFPFYVFNLELPNVDVDVNVHPSKINVKFANPSKIYDLVYTAIKSKIYECLNPIRPTQKVEEQSAQPTIAETPIIKTDLNSLREIELDVNTNATPKQNIELKQSVFSPVTFFDLKQETKIKPTEQTKVDVKAIKEAEPQLAPDAFDIDFKIVGQIFDEFVVIERGNNMILMDFHAAHERLNYDKFTHIVESRQIVTQDLLLPYTQEMTELELEHILSLKDKLYDLGFEVDKFNDKTLIINSIPMQLKDIDLKAFVDDLLHDIKNLNPSFNNEIKHYLMQKACKSSVKSGMQLSEMEILALLKQLDDKNPVLLCPHGRPVLTIVTREQIEKWFKRIV